MNLTQRCKNCTRTTNKERRHTIFFEGGKWLHVTWRGPPAFELLYSGTVCQNCGCKNPEIYITREMRYKAERQKKVKEEQERDYKRFVENYEYFKLTGKWLDD